MEREKKRERRVCRRERREVRRREERKENRRGREKGEKVKASNKCRSLVEKKNVNQHTYGGICSHHES